MSPCEGTIVETENHSENGNTLTTFIIQTHDLYYYFDKKVSSEYQFIITNLSDRRINEGPVDQSTPLGKLTAKTVISVRCPDLDPFLINNSSSQAVPFHGYWYYSPAWLLYGKTKMMTFRPVSSLSVAANTYLEHFESEHFGKTGTDEAEYHWGLHFIESTDRIRTGLVLDSYPGPVTDRFILSGLEKTYFQQEGLYKYESRIFIDGIEVIIYWQEGRKEVLERNYPLGSLFYIHGVLMAAEMDRKQVIFLVIETTANSDEDVAESRIDYINYIYGL